jgi:hypothetical protein
MVSVPGLYQGCPWRVPGFGLLPKLPSAGLSSGLLPEFPPPELPFPGLFRDCSRRPSGEFRQGCPRPFPFPVSFGIAPDDLPAGPARVAPGRSRFRSLSRLPPMIARQIPPGSPLAASVSLTLGRSPPLQASVRVLPGVAPVRFPRSLPGLLLPSAGPGPVRSLLRRFPTGLFQDRSRRVPAWIDTRAEALTFLRFADPLP